MQKTNKQNKKNITEIQRNYALLVYGCHLRLYDIMRITTEVNRNY